MNAAAQALTERLLDIGFEYDGDSYGPYSRYICRKYDVLISVFVMHKDDHVIINMYGRRIRGRVPSRKLSFGDPNMLDIISKICKYMDGDNYEELCGLIGD